VLGALCERQRRIALFGCPGKRRTAWRAAAIFDGAGGGSPGEGGDGRLFSRYLYLLCRALAYHAGRDGSNDYQAGQAVDC